ncbi:MAG: hypothetical protein HY703_10160 [Gemmatimonadetes bacterium]|nr:hypothetical protein [Gemmatimonadota bacterium]
MEYLEAPRSARRRDAVIAGGFLLVALLLFFLPSAYQAQVRQAVRSTALRPFLAAQGELASRRMGRAAARVLRAQRDSLAALVAAQASLAEENRRLRALLGLRPRAEPDFVPAEVIRAGLRGAEATFLVGVGSADGVWVGSPVLAVEGLLGVIWEVDEHTSQAIDWTHPEFRASAMTRNGEVYGIVEPRRGRFREEDMLALTGAPFHSDIAAGARVVTSGRGGIFPRGIPIGTVVGIEEAETGWRKTYLMQPAARPAAVTHVLVGVREGEGARGDLSQLWHAAAPFDTGAAARQPTADSLPTP